MAYATRTKKKPTNQKFQALVLRNRASYMNMLALKKYDREYNDLSMREQEEISLQTIKEEPLPKSILRNKAT